MFSWHYQSGHPAPSLNTVEKGLAIFSKAPFARQQHNQQGYSALRLPALSSSLLAHIWPSFSYAFILQNVHSPPQQLVCQRSANLTSRAFMPPSPHLQVCNLAITSEHCLKLCKAVLHKLHYKNAGKHIGLQHRKVLSEIHLGPLLSLVTEECKLNLCIHT